MKTFLEEVASQIVHQNTALRDVVCIMPSERAGIYLKNELKRALQGKPSFLPRIISIENFIKEISGLESMSQVSLIFEFYKVYRSSFKEANPDTFERFLGWATIAIQDFNEIDRHLVNAEEIFSYLTDIQNINDWTPTKDEVTPTVSNYMSFLKGLNVYYDELKKVLLDKGTVYQGLMYRKAHQQKEEYLERHGSKTFCFIGFNALNKAEEEIFQFFLDQEKNKIFWDVDAYYLDDKHEAGTFVRKFFSEWECLDSESRKNWVNHHFQQKKNIHILGAPLSVTGIKVATSFLKGEIQPSETAMVLAEESLLPVVLNSIPEEVQQVNITMGYSLNNVPLSGLFQSLFDLYLNKQKLGKNAFYYKDIIALLRHPYIINVTENHSIHAIETITKNNLVFITSQELADLLLAHKVSKIVCNIVQTESSISLFLSQVMTLLEDFYEKLEGIDLLYVEGFKKVVQEIINLNEQYEYIDSFNVLSKVFKRLIALETIDFRGDAIGGMQLMGVLETRCLDFKNVIMTSVNEGVLPSGKTERSFISFEVKKHFKMPTYLAKDAIFSYHFYRLLQRAEHIYLLYNNQTDDFGGGEMSRFITRLLIDKEGDIIHKNVVAKLNSVEDNLREVEKTAPVMQVLKAYFQKGASPSRIIEYINDPIEFYQKMVLKIKETDQVEEEVAHNTLGTVVHDSLELLYQPYLNKILFAEDIKAMKTKVDEMVASKFKKYFKEGNIGTGKNKLISEVARQFVVNFLDLELKEISSGKEIVVKELEKACTIDLMTPKGHQIKLEGKIDRVDEVNGVLRIVDYKTGKVEAKDLKLADLSLAVTDFKYHKVVQVLMYVIMYSLEENIDLDTRNLQTGIYSFKNLKSGFLAMNFTEGKNKKEHQVTNEHLNLFKESLLHLVDEILDNKLNFVENTDRAFKKEA